VAVAYTSRVSESDIHVISTPITTERLRELAQEYFGDMIKAVVDVRLNLLALGGELHSDEELALIKQGSQQADLWGINIYFEQSRSDRIEYDSMINIRPRQNNRSRHVENEQTRQRIADVVDALIL